MKARGYKIKRGTVRKQLWDAFSMYIRLRDKRTHGPACRIGRACKGAGLIEVCYHIIPQQRGDSVRYDEDNCVGGCMRCNDGEHWHRSLYRDYHVSLFGKERIEELESRARGIVQFTTAQLIELRDQYRAKLGAR